MSKLGVEISLPKEPTSLNPQSSATSKTIFGRGASALIAGNSQLDKSIASKIFTLFMQRPIHIFVAIEIGLSIQENPCVSTLAISRESAKAARR